MKIKFQDTQGHFKQQSSIQPESFSIEKNGKHWNSSNQFKEKNQKIDKK